MEKNFFLCDLLLLKRHVNGPSGFMTNDLTNELEALESIFPGQLKYEMKGHNYLVYFVDPQLAYSISFELDSLSYPESSAPNFVLSFQNRVGAEEYKQLQDNIARLIGDNKGEVVLYNVIQCTQDIVGDPNFMQNQKVLNPMEEIAVSGTLNSIDCAPLATIDTGTVCAQIDIFHGPVTVEQKSSFQAHFCVVRTMEEVNYFRNVVLSDKRIAKATHNIFAYRFTTVDSGIGGGPIVHHDCDDDGETAAAGRVAEMIRLMGVDGVAVIVSRWFGGVLLGPDRFKFICNAARNLLEEHGYGSNGNGKASKRISGSKK
jgi:hypothetical protein